MGFPGPMAAQPVNYLGNMVVCRGMSMRREWVDVLCDNGCRGTHFGMIVQKYGVGTGAPEGGIPYTSDDSSNRPPHLPRKMRKSCPSSQGAGAIMQILPPEWKNPVFEAVNTGKKENENWRNTILRKEVKGRQ